MKRYHYFLFVIIVSLAFLTGCSSSVTNQEETMPHSSLPPELPASQSVPDDEEMESIYTLNKPIVEYEDYLSVTELFLPETIHEMKIGLVKPISNNKLVVLLYAEEPLPVIKEIGVYDMENENYTTCVLIDKGTTVSVSYADEDVIIYCQQDEESELNSLWLYSFDSNACTKIYDFCLEYNNSSAAFDSIAYYDGKIYFDDVVVTNGEVTDVILMEYNIGANKVSPLHPGSQNPIVFKDSLFYISNDSKDQSLPFYLESAQAADKITLDGRIGNLTSANDELYAMDVEEFDEPTKLAVWNVYSVTDKEKLLTAANAIDNLDANKYLVAWRNFSAEKPIVYLRQADAFAVLTPTAPSGYNTFLLGNEYSILICGYDNAPYRYFRIDYIQ